MPQRGVTPPMRALLLASCVLLLPLHSCDDGAATDAEATTCTVPPEEPPSVLHGLRPASWTADELTGAIEYLQAVQQAQHQGCAPGDASLERPSKPIRRHLRTQRRRRAALYCDVLCIIFDLPFHQKTPISWIYGVKMTEFRPLIRI